MPLSSQQRLLRTTLAVGLIGAARHNIDMGNHDVALFEVAHVYLPPGTTVPDERWRLGGIVQGDFFRAKGIVEAIFDGPAHRADVRARAACSPGFRSARRCSAGWVAQHGPIALDGLWSAFELDLEDLFALVPERILYRDVITFPPLRRISPSSSTRVCRPASCWRPPARRPGAELREVRFLSDYRGDQIPAGKKSLAFAVAFQSPERTLADEDGTRLRSAIVEALAERFGAELRA